MIWIVPWVAGWDGPMLTMTVSSRCGVVNAGRTGLGIFMSISVPRPVSDIEPLAVRHERLLAQLRVILAQRIADKAFVQQQRPQVGIAVEADAVHLVALALHEGRGTVVPGQRLDHRFALGHLCLDAHPDAMLRRVEVPDDVEARLPAGPVDRRDVEQHVELACRLQRVHHSGERGRRDLDNQRAVRHGAGGREASELRLNRIEDGRSHQKSFVRITCFWRAILSWSCMIPSMTVSGRGGQPGMYTSTGMTRSMPASAA